MWHLLGCETCLEGSLTISAALSYSFSQLLIQSVSQSVKLSWKSGGSCHKSCEKHLTFVDTVFPFRARFARLIFFWFFFKFFFKQFSHRQAGAEMLKKKKKKNRSSWWIKGFSAFWLISGACIIPTAFSLQIIVNVNQKIAGGGYFIFFFVFFCLGWQLEAPTRSTK